jgi:hypothetical protein
MMEKFDFFIGSWYMESKVPKSSMSEEDSGTGTGTFRKALNDEYVFFDYHASYSSGEGGAHGIFVWDEKANIYRYWWFEDSGNFMEATCNFVDEDTLYFNWHNSVLWQTFKKIDDNKFILRMEQPQSQGGFELLLKVIFTRKV